MREASSQAFNLRSRFDRVEDLLCIDGCLPDRFDAIEQVIELSGQLRGRLHRDDLVGDELERILDQIELPFGDAEVVLDVLQLLEALQDDREILPGYVALLLRRILRRRAPAPAFAV